MSRIENDRERRRELKDAVYGWTLYRSGFKIFNQVQSQGGARDSNAGIYLEPERKLGFFVKIKEDENFNHRNTGSISRIKI
jgi:hypothetical protein